MIDLETLKKQNFALTKEPQKEKEYIISFFASYQKLNQKPVISEDTIVCKLENTENAKDFLTLVKKYILKEKFKDVNLANLKKLIIFNIHEY